VENSTAPSTGSICVFTRGGSNKSCLEVNPNHAEITKLSHGLQTGAGKQRARGGSDLCLFCCCFHYPFYHTAAWPHSRAWTAFQLQRGL